MDFNNIQDRLERLYVAINSRFDTDVEKYIERKVTPDLYMILPGAGTKEVQTSNKEKIMSIIHNIANLRDHLKNNIAETEVNKHFHSDINLKIIMDLSNADKHGYPTKKNHSKLNPKIENITSSLELVDGDLNVIIEKGHPFLQGNIRIVIDANIMDDKGNRICTLDKLVEKSMLSWETFMKKHNLIQ